MARTTGSNGEETARRIDEVALKLFAQKGYAAVSMREIAREVGVQAGALYNYSPNKQDLLARLMIEHMEALLSAWDAQNPSLLSPLDALKAFVLFHIRYHVERPDHVFISYMELRNLEAENFAKVEELRRQYEAALKAILKRGSIDHLFNIADVHVTAMAILAQLTGVTTWYRAKGRLSQSKIEEIYTQLVCQSVGAQPSEEV
ncbi:TetR/AcrR family transcriptional regulator [Maritalea porphyrae]|jgi:AcrR family transcriptional regulator|uniref:TetR/AcrR family transcriptional regulator n=1 Tax=Maritalea porphyrae TaxID=880732 RepID=UPI0022AEAAFE|nr:TetR/AcrR family transcriptional regulator [Maritalea porphyrae]MCZ4272085.1 TetR/AcrR family transcriptional regulator [Maritalea porphyrae]